MPRLHRRKPSDNKRRLDVEDIYGLYEHLDRAKTDMPLYSAANLSRLPTVHPSDVDVVKLVTNMASLQRELEELKTAFSNVSVDTVKESPSQQPQNNAAVVINQDAADEKKSYVAPVSHQRRAWRMESGTKEGENC